MALQSEKPTSNYNNTQLELYAVCRLMWNSFLEKVADFTALKAYYTTAYGDARLVQIEDATRASMHPLADAIEMRYFIGTTPPATAEDAPNNFISKKALFTFEAGSENGGQRLYIFCRYVNFTNQANNGPWTTVHSGTIQA